MVHLNISYPFICLSYLYKKTTEINVRRRKICNPSIPGCETICMFCPHLGSKSGNGRRSVNATIHPTLYAHHHHHPAVMTKHWKLPITNYNCHFWLCLIDLPDKKISFIFLHFLSQSVPTSQVLGQDVLVSDLATWCTCVRALIGLYLHSASCLCMCARQKCCSKSSS